MIRVDSNVFMYAAGQTHLNKRPSLTFLRRVALGQLDAVIDAEVLQEILHRYVAIGRRSAAGRVYDLARQIVPTVLPITAEHLDCARRLVARYAHLSARDALHSAVVIDAGLDAICSFDTDFDQVGARRSSACVPALERAESGGESRIPIGARMHLVCERPSSGSARPWLRLDCQTPPSRRPVAVAGSRP